MDKTMTSQGMKCRPTVRDLEVKGLNLSRFELWAHSTSVEVVLAINIRHYLHRRVYTPG